MHTACCSLLKSVKRCHWFLSAVGAEGSCVVSAGHNKAVQLENSQGSAVCAPVKLQRAGCANECTHDFLNEGLRLCRKRTYERDSLRVLSQGPTGSDPPQGGEYAAALDDLWLNNTKLRRTALQILCAWLRNFVPVVAETLVRLPDSTLRGQTWRVPDHPALCVQLPHRGIRCSAECQKCRAAARAHLWSEAARVLVLR